jgi:hypothetical protein
MGIIISSFPGCGKRYLMNTYGDKARILNADIDFVKQEGEYDYNLFVDKIMGVVNNYDIVFIPSGKGFLDAFNNRNIDYDLFYPSKERRGEFIENAVRKRMTSHDIMWLDREFNGHIDRFDSIDTPNCYKHKMSESGHFIGNDNAIMGYLNSLKNTNINNAQESKERMEESPRGESDDEGDEKGA